MATIVVAGANGRVGAALIPLLIAAGHRVTGLTRTAPSAAPTTVTGWLAAPEALQAVADADVIVNLAGAVNPPRGESWDAGNVAPAERLLALRSGRPAAQAIAISYPGAQAGSRNAFLDAKGRMEAATRRLAARVAIARVSTILGTPEAPTDFDRSLAASPGGRGRMFGTGRTRLRPVLLTDVAAVLAAWVERGVAGTFALEGPEEVTADGLVRLLSRDPALRVSHTPGWASVALAPVIGMRRDMVRLFLRDSLDPSPSAFAAAGLAATPPSAVWGPRR